MLSGRKDPQLLSCPLVAAPSLTPATTTARRKYQQGRLLSHRKIGARRWHSYFLAQCLEPTKQSVFDQEVLCFRAETRILVTENALHSQ